MRGFFIFEGTPSFLKKYQKGTPSLLIAVPQPQVILERQITKIDPLTIEDHSTGRGSIYEFNEL